MKKLIALLGVLTMVFAFGGVVHAGALNDAAESDLYPVAMTGKILDGTIKIIESPFQLIEKPYEHTVVNGDWAFGLFSGALEGTYHTAQKATHGTMDVVKAPMP